MSCGASTDAGVGVETVGGWGVCGLVTAGVDVGRVTAGALGALSDMLRTLKLEAKRNASRTARGPSDILRIAADFLLKEWGGWQSQLGGGADNVGTL